MTTIGEKAFEFTKNMTSCNFAEGSNLTDIGKFAFRGSGLTYFKLPDKVKEIKTFTFSETALTTIAFSENTQLTTIGWWAFALCPLLYNCKIPASVTDIGLGAFMECPQLYLDIPSLGQLQTIGANAFYNCAGITMFIIPKNLVSIGVSAFENCTKLTKIGKTSECKLESIGSSAFKGCTAMVVSQLPSTLNNIGANAFENCSALESVVLPDNVTVGDDAFTGCVKLTFYIPDTFVLSQFNLNSNRSCRPMVIGCKVDSASRRVLSIEKNNGSILFANAENGISNPKEDVIDTFEGWCTNADFSGTTYANIAAAPNGTLYAKWKDSCIAEGSMITLADGTQKAVEDLTGDEQLLVWNMFTGKFDSAPIMFIDSESRQSCEVINLEFSDGTTVKVISEHAFWDIDLNRYVFLRADAAKYIGHSFNKQTVGADGEMSWTAVKLTGVEITREITTAWSPVTYGHLCYYVNGMLTMPGATEGLINIFDIDPETMTVDRAAYERDVEQYGLFTYEEFNELVPVSEQVFDAFNGQYLKVAIGKGLTSVEKLAALIARYQAFLE